MSTTAAISDDVDIDEHYITKSGSFSSSEIIKSEDYNLMKISSPRPSQMLTFATSQTSLPYKNWWVFDSGSGRHIYHQKDFFRISDQ